MSSSFYLFNGHNTCELILSVKVPITVGVMLNFDGDFDFDGHSDGDLMCKQTSKYNYEDAT